MQKKNVSPHNLEQCQKCAICNQVCPVMLHNPVYSGPKQNGPDGERYRMNSATFFDEAMRFCMNCKRCEIACPSNVLISDMIQEAKLSYGNEKPGLRDRLLSSTDFIGRMASPAAAPVNALLRNKAIRGMAGAVLRLSTRCTLPAYSSRTFEAVFRTEAEDRQKTYARKVAFFHGCYVNYNDPGLGMDFIAVLNALGYGVQLLDGERCCALPKIVNGLKKEAVRDAGHNLSLIRGAASEGLSALTLSPSCTITLRDEYPNVLHVDNSDVRESIILAEKFIYDAIVSGEAVAVWKTGGKDDSVTRAAYHCPCHQRSLGWGIYTTKLMRMIPGIKVIELDDNCCGMAGTYGLKKENEATASSIGEALFSQIRKVNPDFVVCECESCKWQIESSTGYRVLNPVSLLAEHLDIEATAAANRKA